VEGSGGEILAGRKKQGTLALTAGVTIIMAVLSVNAVISYLNTRQLVYNNGWVQHTFEVISELDLTLSQLKDAETGQRGYLITHDPVYLEPYDLASAEVSTHIDRVADLTRDNENQQRRIPQLRQLVIERLNIARENIELEKAGRHADAISSVVSKAGKSKMDQVRELVGDMRKEEELLLRERTASSQQSLRRTIVTFVVATFTALIFVLVYYLVARKELSQSIAAARAIKDREAWLHTTLRSIGDAVIATDRRGAVKFLNGVAEKLTGFNSLEAEGMPIAEVFPIFNEVTKQAVENPVEKVLESGIVVGLANHTVLRNRDGHEIPIEDSAAPIMDDDRNISGVVLVFRDVEQQRLAEESARKSEKLAAAGRLAATIAHEINNPLEAITNLLFLARTAESLEDARQYLSSADQELARVAHITRQTLGFVRATAAATETRISALVEEVLMVYSGRIRARQIDVVKDFADDVAITAFRGDLVQIFSNLVANALDAMGSGGTLSLSANATDGGVIFEIQDSGTGISSVNQKRIFDAFFTTKTDVGTGLGLWVVKDLLEKFGGTIEVESSIEPPDQGTRFILFIPSVVAGDPVKPHSETAVN
jgi:PAS domain S-box-containing protein